MYYCYCVHGEKLNLLSWVMRLVFTDLVTILPGVVYVPVVYFAMWLIYYPL